MIGTVYYIVSPVFGTGTQRKELYMTTLPTAIAVIVATLASKDPGTEELLRNRGAEAAQAAIIASAGEHRFLGTDAAGRAALLTAWSFYESRWDACAKGDSGRSLGVMQVNKIWMGSKHTSLICDLSGGFTAAVRILDSLTQQCTTPRGVLTAYSSGRCSSTKGVNAFVEQRWAIAGLPAAALDKPFTK